MDYPVYNINEIALIKCSRSGSRSTSGIINNKLTFEKVITPQQCAEYFNLDYRGIVNGEDTEKSGDVEGDVHMFIDHNNNDAKIYVSDDLLEKETGLLKTGWYENNYQTQAEKWDWDEEKKKEVLEGSTYPLRQLFKDYDDIPSHLKKCIGILNLSNEEYGDRVGDCCADIFGKDESRCHINIYKGAFETSGFKDEISQNARCVLYHELGHGFAHKLEYDNRWGSDWDTGSHYFATHSKYTNAKKEDKKLNGDKWATDYGESSRKNSEECADVSMIVLLNHLKGKDQNYSRYRVSLPYSTTYPNDTQQSFADLSVDEWIERYPNRAKVVKEMMGI